MIAIGLGREGAFGRFDLGKTMDRGRAGVRYVPGNGRKARGRLAGASRVCRGRCSRPLAAHYAVDMDVDLVVFGASGRSVFVEALIVCAA